MDRLDMTGAWFGHFAYRDGRTPPVQFIASIRETDGQFHGEVSEPNSIGTSSPYLHALIDGARSGREVGFRKLYDGAADAAHSVSYQGELSPGGEVCAGEWRLAGEGGPLRMTRSHVAENEALEIAETELLDREADA